MKLLVDTNVVLDYLLRREPFFENAAKILLLSEKGYVKCFVSASSITDIFYIAKRELKDTNTVLGLLEKLLNNIRVATVSEKSIYEALELKWKDFEDSVQFVVGKSVSVEYIITRNLDDFSNNQIKVSSPKDFLDLIINKD
jgi:predicted nucleic-acid-binding protein